MRVRKVDILIPTYKRPVALAVTLSSLCFQEFEDYNVIVSDQSEDHPVDEIEEIQAITRFLKLHGREVRFLRNLPRRGMAQQRQFLLEHARSKYVLYLDDDLILEPFVLKNLVDCIESEKCGLVGTGTIGLNYIDQEREQEQFVEFWQGRVGPETVRPRSPQWRRHVLHNAANLFHLQKRLKLNSKFPKKYKLAWASACVLYDREKLIQSGAFDFWRDVPEEHCGEDVAAQLRVMAKFGGCGIAPSGVYHQELKTTIPRRKFNIPESIELFKEL